MPLGMNPNLAHTLRSRRSKLLVLGAVLLVLAVCMQVGAGAKAAPSRAATQPATTTAEKGALPAAGAADSNTSPGWGRFTRQVSEFGSTGSDSPLWRMLGMLVVVAVLGGLALWFVRRVMPRIQQSRGRNIAVLETASLGPHKSVHLLRVGQKQFLVASTRERISMLAEVTDADTDAGDDFASKLAAQQEKQS